MDIQKHFFNSSAWNWKNESVFSNVVTAGDQVFISGQQTLDETGCVLDSGDIAAQTRNVFENMKKSLATVDLGLEDLVRLNTYYVFNGDDNDATAFWEDMTKVRLEYFPDPGPAATAVRVKGMPYQGQLIQIEGVAVRGDSKRSRQRIMPKDSWDWSIAVLLSQGWKTGNRVFVGGQISADKAGGPVHVGDLEAQTRSIYDFIGQVLSDADASFEDLLRVKICFKYDSKDPDTGQSFVDRIMEVSKEYVVGPAPVVTAFAVDLLYPGLDLELDAMAIVDPDAKILDLGENRGRYQPAVFSDGVSADGEIYLGGQTAIESDGSVMFPGDFLAQTHEVFRRLDRTLSQAEVTLDDIVKLNFFIVAEDEEVEDCFHAACKAWSELAPSSHPAMTPVRVHELPKPGLLFQADCVAIK